MSSSGLQLLDGYAHCSSGEQGAIVNAERLSSLPAAERSRVPDLQRRMETLHRHRPRQRARGSNAASYDPNGGR
ncbi:MAG: hypothetical protein IPM46_00950 [Flavobacteriales bacterium]|nr:hypothetical protein [Flavobacteriales bacterium]